MLKKHYQNELKLSQAIKLGDTGPDVSKIQEWLNLQYNSKNTPATAIKIDGIYGPQTQNAILEFQENNNLRQTGIVDTTTFFLLSKPLYDAFNYKPVNTENISELIVMFARKHLKCRPRELNKRNNGPWVRSYMNGNEGQNYPWCMGFAQTILDQAYSCINKKFTEVIPKSISCTEVGNYGLKNNKLIRNTEIKSNLHKIKPGSLILKSISKNQWSHTGIIISINQQKIETIEGNTNKDGSSEGYTVCQHKRKINDRLIDIYTIV
ncbi:peptidoglycan-binding protein [Bacteroidota bacterium]